LGGKKNDAAVLDYSSPPPKNEETGEDRESDNLFAQNANLVGKFKGELPGLDDANEEELESEEEDGAVDETKAYVHLH
jgi:hypothetical protein